MKEDKDIKKISRKKDNLHKRCQSAGLVIGRKPTFKLIPKIPTESVHNYESSLEKIFDEFEKEQCRYSKRDFIDWDNYQKLKQQIMQKFNEIRKDALEDGSLGLIKKSDLDFLKQERQKTIEMIDKEKDIVKVCCLGLVHPDQTNQEEFIKWLQNTVIFHLEDLKRRVEKI